MLYVLSLGHLHTKRYYRNPFSLRCKKWCISTFDTVWLHQRRSLGLLSPLVWHGAGTTVHIHKLYAIQTA